MPIIFAEVNTLYCVKRITGKDDVRNHLANLGFVEGAELKVIQKVDGNLIVEVKGVRLALDRSLAQRIMV